MSERLDISVTADGDEAVSIFVSGEIDLSNVDGFRQALSSAAQAGQRLNVDLTGVAYIDSAGMAALFERAGRGPLEVRCHADSVVAPLIDITRLGDVASIRKE